MVPVWVVPQSKATVRIWLLSALSGLGREKDFKAVMKALDKRLTPDGRFASAAAFSQALEGVFGESPDDPGTDDALAILLALDRNIYHWTPLAGMHFLYVAPIIFLVSAIIIFLVSTVTTPPSETKVNNYVWKFSAFAEESAEIAALPWYQNYRILSVLLLIFTGIFVYIWR